MIPISNFKLIPKEGITQLGLTGEEKRKIQGVFLNSVIYDFGTVQVNSLWITFIKQLKLSTVYTDEIETKIKIINNYLLNVKG